MIRRELSKDEFIRLEVALRMAAAQFRAQRLLTPADHCDDLRKLFESAHTSWLEIEE